MHWREIRELFSVLKEITYINAASVGILPDTAVKAAQEWLNERRYGNIYWLSWYEKFSEAKALFAELIKTRADNVCGVYNTTEGLNFVANSIRWKAGENIVINDLEFPTNVFIWQIVARKHGLELRVVKNRNGVLHIEDYERVIDDKTRAIAVSWVEFSNGYVHDLKALAEIAHEHNAYLIVDGIQGVGSLYIDVERWGIDFLACGGHKWLLGFPGSGFLYIRREILDELDIPFAGWLGDKDPYDFSFREFRPADSAKRFELGSPSFIGYVALERSLKLILDIGIERIQKRNLELVRYLIEELGERYEIESPLNDGYPVSPIIRIKVAKSDEIVEKLREHKIFVASRRGGIRVSPHFYNDKSDIDKFVRALKQAT